MDHAHITICFKAFIALLVLVNPLEGMSVLLSATKTSTPALRNNLTKIASFSVFVILILSCFLGNGLLHVFGISTGAFQTGGGIVLFLIAVKMVLGSGDVSFGETQGGEIKKEFAIVPLATPIMAGPGAINGAVLYGTQARTISEMALLAAVIFFVSLVTYIILRTGTRVAHYLKETGITIITRTMGLIIAAIAIEMIAHGVTSLFNMK